MLSKFTRAQSTRGRAPPLRPEAVEPIADHAAAYGDGASASRIAAKVRLERNGLQVMPAGGAPQVWRYADLRAAEPIRKRSLDAVLMSREAGRASLFVDDTLLLARLIERAPHLKLGVERWNSARPGLAVGAMALAGYAGIMVFDLSPTKGVARTMPEKARMVLGDSVVRTMPAQGRCIASEGRSALGKLMRRLMPRGPITADDIIVLDWSLLNAFAVPGNRIVLTRGLIEQAQGPDEIAAVIGHEAGHSIELHPEATLVRSVGFWALVQMVFTGTPGAIGNIGVVLAQLSYTRSAEREADGHALRLLKEAHISPKGMGDFFRRMDKRAETPSPKVGEANVSSDILSSHPSNPERIARIDSQPAYAATASLADEDWKSLKEICASTDAEPAPKTIPPVASHLPEAKQDASQANGKAEVAKDAAARAEIARAEAAKAEAARREAAQQEVRRTQAAKEEADRKAAAKADAERLVAARKEAALRAEAEKKVETTKAETGKSDTEAANGNAQVALATGVPGPLATVPRAMPVPVPIEVRISEASKRIAANAADTAALIERGQAYAAKPDATAAIEDFSRVLALKPADANTLFWRASMLAQKGLLDQAIADYNDVLKLQPRNFAAFNNRGSLYRSQKKLDLALRDYTAAIAIDGKQAIALTNRALIHRERNDLAAALVDLNAAIAANPSYANAYVRRGETRELKAERDAAVADYRTVLRLPETPGGASEPHLTARARLTTLGVKF